MTRILTLVLAAGSLILASCECCKPKKADSCCAEGKGGGDCCAEGKAKAGASCCAEPGKGDAHQH